MVSANPSLLPVDAVGQRLLLAFHGKDHLPAELKSIVHDIRPAGFTLFRPYNIDHPQQVRLLTDQLQQLALEAGLPPFLIAADQEGGQLNAIGPGTTQLPGNLALGAADSTDLARQAGEVLGCELAAMGINVDFAPVCDVNSNPRNPVIGTRSFGEDPHAAARLASALIAGIQSQGVAATAKHFPGHGDTSGDSHFGVPVVDGSLERLHQVELPPFRTAVEAGVSLVMTAHLALPALDGRSDLPATLSHRILTGLLREEMGFGGVIVTDAMNMKAIRQGDALGEEAVRAVEAGADLLLMMDDPADQRRAYDSILTALRLNHLDPQLFAGSLRRIQKLKAWIASSLRQPELEVVGSPAHRKVADQIAEKSITLVRDDRHLLPLHLDPEGPLAVVLPQPLDLTPADTSSYITHSLPAEVRRFHPTLDVFEVSHHPTQAEIASVRERLAARPYAAVIAGTINAFASEEQAALVNAVLLTGLPTIAVALRMPYDPAAYPEVPTCLCTYSLLEPSMRALAQVVFGEIAPLGRLPVSIPGLYPLGHRAIPSI